VIQFLNFLMHMNQNLTHLYIRNQSSQANKKRKSREVPPIGSEDLHLLVALRKDPRSCTNKPLYPLSSFEQLSPTYKAFLTNLNTTIIPTLYLRHCLTGNRNKPWTWKWRHLIRTILGNWFLYQMEKTCRVQMGIHCKIQG
jgi:hypothetical protein